ncbi:hypothetical protein F4820DRAFT_405859 [Hypoxylon rubiginosum]|uniref:Uncharacterized protein n=1 Tax=Hypoxylon rubiginosum TaxID=110542 RepID=A0ACB9ZFH2_9PEZI|nr:hypothetical protein F4820DRAFT_405859 [Hypoxylon rubiginosum]
MMPARLNTGSQGTTIEEIPCYPDFAPTDDVPWIEEDQRQMLRLVEREPVVSLSIFLHEMAEDRIRPRPGGQGSWDSHTMRKLVIEKSMADLLLHSVPKILLGGLIMGISGWQARLPAAHPLALPHPIYKSDGPGTYIVSMGVQGRNGRGPSDKMDAYLDAYEVLENSVPEHRTPAECKLVQDAQRIDLFYAEKFENNGKPAFLEKDAETRTRKMRCLINMFRGFRTKAPNPDKPLLQTPSYVGCATESICGQSSGHLPSNEFQGSDYAWWLTMSCLRDMGLAPDVQVLHAVRTWEPEHLPISEILMTVLGRTEVENWGFNCRAPGSTKHNPAEPHDWDEDVMDVWIHRDYLQDQLRESQEGLDRAIRAMTEIPKLESEVQSLQWETMALLGQEAANAPTTFEEEEEVRNEIRLNQEAIDELDRINADLDLCLSLFDALPVSDEDGDEDEDAAASS